MIRGKVYIASELIQEITSSNTSEGEQTLGTVGASYVVLAFLLSLPVLHLIRSSVT